MDCCDCWKGGSAAVKAFYHDPQGIQRKSRDASCVKEWFASGVPKDSCQRALMFGSDDFQ